MMVEFQDATQLTEQLKLSDVYGLWAPGDATVYRVTLLHAAPLGDMESALDGTNDLDALVVIAGRDVQLRSNSVLLIPRPQRADLRWSAGRFYQTYGNAYAGWWAGIRPLLAALGWATSECGRPVYEPTDAVLIDLVAREGVRR